MRRRPRRAFDIFLADAPRHGCRRADCQTERNRVNYRHHRFRDADDRHRVRAQMRDKENIHDGKEAFHHHFQDHRN